MILRIRPLLTGLATFLPGMTRFVSRTTGGTSSARYCYSVWLRHLTTMYQNGIPIHPTVVAELGPGDSLGVGLAALLSGARQYFAFDVLPYAHTDRNVAVFDELVALFRQRAPIPDADEFPLVTPYLDCYAFPHEIVPDEHLDVMLDPARIASIRAALTSGDRNDGSGWITYQVPWDGRDHIRDESVDMIVSQTVLEYPLDLHRTYETLFRWLKPGGTMSHVIDFRCLGTANVWNGHWTYSDLTWALITGRRAYPIANREPHSTHIRLMEERGFTIVGDRQIHEVDGVPRRLLAPRFRNMTDDDFTTSIAMIQALKPL